MSAANFPARNVSIIDILDPGAPLFYDQSRGRPMAGVKSVRLLPLFMNARLPRPAISRTARAVCATHEGLSMSDAPKRRLIDQLGVSPTFVAEGCRFTGDVETTGPLVVCGTIRGDGKVGGPLSMAAKAHWEGEIHAQAAVVAARSSGQLVSDE